MWKSKLEEFFVKREISCQYIDIYSEENMSGSKRYMIFSLFLNECDNHDNVVLCVF